MTNKNFCAFVKICDYNLFNFINNRPGQINFYVQTHTHKMD